MEVSPEMYAWFTSLNIINPFMTFEEENIEKFIIPDKVINLLLGGKYMDIILKHLQDSYNKFYKVKMDFTSKMKDLIDIDVDQDYISNSVKYANWHLIGDTIKQFGLNYSEEEIMKVINGDKALLMTIITKIYELFTQFLKHADNAKLLTKNSNLSSNTSKNKSSISSFACAAASASSGAHEYGYNVLYAAIPAIFASGHISCISSAAFA